MVVLLRSWALLVTVQSLGERTQFFLEVFRFGVSAGVSVDIRSRGSVFASRRVPEEFVALFQLFSLGICAEPCRGSVIP